MLLLSTPFWQLAFTQSFFFTRCITEHWTWEAQGRYTRSPNLLSCSSRASPQHNSALQLHSSDHYTWMGGETFRKVSLEHPKPKQYVLVKKNHASNWQHRRGHPDSHQLASHSQSLVLFFSALFTAKFTPKILPHTELRAGWMSPAWSRCLTNLLPHVFKHFTCRKRIKARRLNMDVQSLINIPTGKLGVFYL